MPGLIGGAQEMALEISLYQRLKGKAGKSFVVGVSAGYF
jgi:hypothetical protein